MSDSLEPRRPGRPPNLAAREAIAVASRKLEADLGGREQMVANLLTVSLPEELEPFVDLLSDEANADLHLNELATRTGVSLSKILHLYEQAVKQRSKLISAAHIAQRLSEVAKGTMELSIPKEKRCRKCKGKGLVEDKKEEMMVLCRHCDGEGTIEYEPSVPQQRTALELGGVLEKVPLVQNTISQQQAVFTTPGSDLVATQRAVHQLLSRGPAFAGPAPSTDTPTAEAPTAIDATLVPGESEASGV